MTDAHALLTVIVEWRLQITDAVYPHILHGFETGGTGALVTERDAMEFTAMKSHPTDIYHIDALRSIDDKLPTAAQSAKPSHPLHTMRQVPR